MLLGFIYHCVTHEHIESIVFTCKESDFGTNHLACIKRVSAQQNLPSNISTPSRRTSSGLSSYSFFPSGNTKCKFWQDPLIVLLWHHRSVESCLEHFVSSAVQDMKLLPPLPPLSPFFFNLHPSPPSLLPVGQHSVLLWALCGGLACVNMTDWAPVGTLIASFHGCESVLWSGRVNKLRIQEPKERKEEEEGCGGVKEWRKDGDGDEEDKYKCWGSAWEWEIWVKLGETQESRSIKKCRVDSSEKEISKIIIIIKKRDKVNSWYPPKPPPRWSARVVCFVMWWMESLVREEGRRSSSLVGKRVLISKRSGDRGR